MWGGDGGCGKWLFSVYEHMDFITEGALLAWREGLGLLSFSWAAAAGTAQGAGWRPQSSLVCCAKQILALPWSTVPASSTHQLHRAPCL